MTSEMIEKLKKEIDDYGTVNDDYQEFRSSKLSKINDLVRDYRINKLEFSFRDMVDGIDMTRANISHYEHRKPNNLTNVLLYIYRAKGQTRNDLIDELANILKEDV